MALLLPQLVCALLLGCFFAKPNLEAGLFLEVIHLNLLTAVHKTELYVYATCFVFGPFCIYWDA